MNKNVLRDGRRAIRINAKLSVLVGVLGNALFNYAFDTFYLRLYGVSVGVLDAISYT